MEKFLVKYQIPLISFNSQNYQIEEFNNYHEAAKFASEKSLIKNKLSGKVVFGKIDNNHVFNQIYYGCRQLTHVEKE
jgi:ribosomal protein L35AE/L33A